MATDKKQTNAIHIYTPAVGPKRIEVERETIRTYENGDQWPVRGASKRIAISVPDIRNEPLPGGPVTVTTHGDVLKLFLETCADAFETKFDADRAAEKKPPVV